MIDMSATSNKSNGVLFERRASEPLTARSVSSDAVEPKPERSSHPVAFAGLLLFTLLLYIRPGDLIPGVAEVFPIVKVVAIGTILAYILARVTNGERLTAWPLELKMVAVIVLLGIVFIPISASKSSTMDMLTDNFLKVVTIFMLMINLLDTKERIYSILRLVVVCGSVVALGTIWSVTRGGTQVDATDNRLTGFVSGIFGNANDFAIAMNLLLPLAIVLALNNKGLRRWLYFACAAALVLGVILSFSRGGFLGLIAMGMVLLWKVGRHNKVVAAMLVLMGLMIFASAVPNGYTERLFTIFNYQQDKTGSAQERKELLDHALGLARTRLIYGVGMGNFGVYSISNKAAHNSYVEILVELGIVGLFAYLILLLTPLRSLKRIERETAHTGRVEDREIYNLSVGVRAAIVAYIVCSFFGSVQYSWFIYYPIAYAIALKRVHLRNLRCQDSLIENEQLKKTTVPAQPGALWSASK